MGKESNYKRVGMSFKKDLLEDIDTLAEMLNVTRSGLISSIVSEAVLKRKNDIKNYKESKNDDIESKHERLMMKENW